ncbi:hypothetical protein D3C80_1631220 [compost metagenome]
MVKHSRFSLKLSFHCNATSTPMPSSRWMLKWNTWLTAVLLTFRYSTKARRPPSYLNSSSLPLRSSLSMMPTPELRNDSSRRRLARMSQLKWILAKVSADGLKWIWVPVVSESPTMRMGSCGTPCT